MKRVEREGDMNLPLLVVKGLKGSTFFDQNNPFGLFYGGLGKGLFSERFLFIFSLLHPAKE